MRPTWASAVFYLAAQLCRVLLVVRVIISADVGGDREAGGTGRPRFAISASPAPLPPSRLRIEALPSARPSPKL